MEEKKKKPDILMGFLLVLLALVTVFNIGILSYVGVEMVPFLLNRTEEPQDSGGTAGEAIPTPAAPKENSAVVSIVRENLRVFNGANETKQAIYLGELKNQGNTPVQLSNLSIDVKDAQGTLLTSKAYVSAYPNVIGPGETAYICEQVIGVTDTGLDASLAEKAILHYDTRDKAGSSVPAKITQASLRTKASFPTLTGAIQNEGTGTLENIYISAPVFSADGQLQTVIFTILDSLEPGQEKGFEQSAVVCDTSLDYTTSSLGDISIYQVSFSS